MSCGCNRSRGGDELRGNALVVRGFVVREAVMDRLRRLVLFVGNDDRRNQVTGLVDGGLDDRHFVGTAAAEEEGTQLHGGLLGENTTNDLGRVRHAGIAQDVAEGSGGTGLRVPGAEDDTINACRENGTRAHRAGFQGDDECAARQAPGTSDATSLTERDDFGVTCGIVVRLAAVPSAADDPAVVVDDDGPDGDISRLAGTVGQEKGLAHCFAVLLIHGHPTSLPAKSQLG